MLKQMVIAAINGSKELMRSYSTDVRSSTLISTEEEADSDPLSNNEQDVQVMSSDHSEIVEDGSIIVSKSSSSDDNNSMTDDTPVIT